MGRYWVQAECVLVEADDRPAAIAAYRTRVAQGAVPCYTGAHCSAMLYLKGTHPETYQHFMAQQACDAADDDTGSLDV